MPCGCVAVDVAMAAAVMCINQHTLVVISFLYLTAWDAILSYTCGSCFGSDSDSDYWIIDYL